MGNTTNTNDVSNVIIKKRKKLTTADMALIAILLAVGTVLKNVINFGMKPNFIIAMYCLVILLIKPTVLNSAIIGLLAGALCQLFPGTPFVNFASELVGAVVMALFMKIPSRDNKFIDNVLKVAPSTFITTLFSGFTFLGLMWILFYAGVSGGTPPASLGVFLVIIFGTATINTVIVQVLYLPIKKILKR
ncbi:MAG: hypothetical protein LBT88_01580 [Oscillospiraceae bacterium]|jgi:hypothetical protein|nr:hypothetical protein [Oscillospiraceae bacterium]